MVSRRQIQESKAIQRRTGRTFHLATRLLPERVRRPTYVLYAFFRTADEVVDAPGTQDWPAEQKLAEIERLRREALDEVETDDPVIAAFREVADRHDIPDREIEVFLDAMRSDVVRDRYPTYDDLETYMRGSASAVGAMTTAVMDPDDREAALPHAVALGKAFQMTNFLRDVREDVVDRDRIYLPLETLDDHGVATGQIERLEFDEDVAAAVASELRRTERLYREGVAGIEYLPRDCQFAVLLSAVLYADHHRLIRDQGYDVLTSEPSLSSPRKLWLLAKTRWHWALNRSPKAVFRRVSAVPVTERGRSDHDHGGTVPVP